MAAKILGTVADPDMLRRLSPLLAYVRRFRARQLENTEPRADDERPLEVFGVKAAKDSLSALVREVEEGRPVFIQRDDDQPVMMIALDVVAEAFDLETERRSATFAECAQALPFSAEQLGPLKLRGGDAARLKLE